MLAPPEELDGSLARADARDRSAPREPAPATGASGRSVVAATSATTVALAPRGWRTRTAMALWALAALTFVAAAWLFLSSGP